MTSEDLRQMAWAAEDNGSEVEVYRHEVADELIHYIEIDGETYLNDELSDELDEYTDAYAYDRGLEESWRE